MTQFSVVGQPGLLSRDDNLLSSGDTTGEMTAEPGSPRPCRSARAVTRGWWAPGRPIFGHFGDPVGGDAPGTAGQGWHTLGIWQRGPEVSVTPMVRAQSLRGYRDLVADLGGDPEQLLHDAGLDPSALDQLTAFISFERSIDLLERSATELACADFGLRLAERQDLGILGTLAVGMRYSATVGEALACAAEYLPVHNAAVAFDINAEQRQQTTLVLRVLGGPSQPCSPRHSAACARSGSPTPRSERGPPTAAVSTPR
jgi:hypothetical protein